MQCIREKHVFNEDKDHEAPLGTTSVSNLHGVLANHNVGYVSQGIHSNHRLVHFGDAEQGLLVACSEGVHGGVKGCWCLFWLSLEA